MKRIKPTIIKCEQCGKEILRHVCNIKNANHHYCSLGCTAKARMKEKQTNTKCANCGKPIFKWPYEFIRSPNHFCDMKCRGEWQGNNWVGEKAKNWRGGSWNNRIQVLAHTVYRTWRAKQLKNKSCMFCGKKDKLELHHIESKIINKDRIQDPTNVIPICDKCHDILHSNNSKGRELRESLSAYLAYGNPQPSLPNVQIFVGGKVQRLISEDAQSNKLDTSSAAEKHDIVWPISKDIEAVA